jgi:glycerophosphoryl diester phosphodiesterase
MSALLVVALAVLHADGPPAPLPVSAHNCYPLDGRGNARLVEALKLGIDNIEIDLGWDEADKRLIVSHDEKPRPDATYPVFEAYLVPALEAHWQSPRADKAPTVLTIDWKTSQSDAVRRFKEFLDLHPDWFSTAPKAEKGPLTVRRLTVCFTGSDAAKDLYDSMIEPGGTYRAFRDSVFGANAYRDDVKSYALRPASTYHRFLTFHWANIERGGPPGAGDFTAVEGARLKALMAHAHKLGYRVRFYCLDGRLTRAGLGYHFVDLDAAIIRWRVAAESGVDWVATDDNAEIVQALRPPKSPR